MKPPTGCRKKEKNVVVEAHSVSHSFIKKKIQKIQIILN